MIEFVAQFDLGIVAGLQRHRRIDAIALQVTIVAESIAAFVKDIHARRDVC